MEEVFDKGIAFVFEGDTEKYFYINLLKFFCDKNAGWKFEEYDSIIGGVYLITTPLKRVIIHTNTVGTITQIVHSGNWFNNACAGKYSAKMPWDVFLCYDTDSHKGDVSKFQENDWKTLRANLAKRNNICVYDMAASADMEDVFLKDLASISNFLLLPKPLTVNDVPPGRKGKRRLKALFRLHGQYYHEGQRAKPLIEALDKQTIINSGILPLLLIESSIR